MANIASNDVIFGHDLVTATEPNARSRAKGANVLGLGIAHAFKVIAERLFLSRQRRADAEVGRFIEEHGGQLTDDLERQISRRFGTYSGQW